MYFISSAPFDSRTGFVRSHRVVGARVGFSTSARKSFQIHAGLPSRPWASNFVVDIRQQERHSCCRMPTARMPLLLSDVNNKVRRPRTGRKPGVNLKTFSGGCRESDACSDYPVRAHKTGARIEGSRRDEIHFDDELPEDGL